jgi:hypothetical protein
LITKENHAKEREWELVKARRNERKGADGTEKKRESERSTMK